MADPAAFARELHRQLREMNWALAQAIREIKAEANYGTHAPEEANVDASRVLQLISLMATILQQKKSFRLDQSVRSVACSSVCKRNVAMRTFCGGRMIKSSQQLRAPSSRSRKMEKSRLFSQQLSLRSLLQSKSEIW
jgi:hypothetical protein